MVNIKILRVKHNLFLVGMEFSYTFFRLHSILKDTFLEICGRNQEYVQQTQVSPICFLSSFHPLCPNSKSILLTIIIHVKCVEEPIYIFCSRFCSFTKLLPVQVCWMQGARNCLASGVMLFISLIGVLADIFEGKRQVNWSDRVR